MKPLLLAPLLCLLSLAALADEGMWMLPRLDAGTRRAMRQLGLRLPARELYHPRRPSLKDAVVSFGGFCSGVVVSREGLVLTNHHCGFESVQQHSAPGHDYVIDGFVARRRADELPCPGLYVRFLVRQQDVTRRVLAAIPPGAGEERRAWVADSVCHAIGQAVGQADSTLVGVVDSYYGGTQYWLSVYRDYPDVRLVMAPPSSVGKFGWERDNWRWPRHTGDFCFFRVYTAPDGSPAPYAPANVPLRPRRVAPVATGGYREGDFCMTLGYPGETRRYLSSWGVEEHMRHTNQARIDVRTLKLDIWRQAMRRNDSLRLKYAAKYDASSNYWKNSIGTNRALARLGVVRRKRQAEQRLAQRLESASDSSARLLPALACAYADRREAHRAEAYFAETFLDGPDLLQLALTVLSLDLGAEPRQVEAQLRHVADLYAATDTALDRTVFAALLRQYRSKVPSRYLPAFYAAIDSCHGGDERAFVDSVYAATQLATPAGLHRHLSHDAAYDIYADPAVSLALDLVSSMFDFALATRRASLTIDSCERVLGQAMRRMDARRRAYPDANATLRLSFGTVAGCRAADAVDYACYTTVRGVLEKARTHAGDPDFSLQPALSRLLSGGDYGPYADPASGEMHVCFLTTNDITGGNSGSAIFNARGELLGLAFDSNWEGLAGDFLYDPARQRTIGVDIRYVLFITDRYAHAPHLLRELEAAGGK